MADELLKEFYKLFGEKGGDIFPGNVDESRTIANVCRELMESDEPVLYEYFENWEKRPKEERKPSGIERNIIMMGQWEGAWTLAQLHYDQTLKQEAKTKKRLPKGHPLCNLALAGSLIDSPSLIRHYALLSSAGDIYWEHENPSLKFGGLAPTILEQFESGNMQQTYRCKIREKLRSFAKNDEPVYLEALLASRWFSDTYSTHITNLSKVEGKGGKPFVEVLLDAVENSEKCSDTATGTRFEAAAGILLSATPGFEVDSARQRTDEQIDLVVYYKPDRLAQIGLETGPGLIECKSSGDKVSASELRDFGTKCLFHRVKFGILFARAGTTGDQYKFKELQSAELVRCQFQVNGLTLLVLDMSQLRKKSRDLRGLSDGLSADYKLLTFGPIA